MKIPACHSELFAAHVSAGEKEEGAEASKDEDTGEAADVADGTGDADAADADDPEESLPTKDSVRDTPHAEDLLALRRRSRPRCHRRKQRARRSRKLSSQQLTGQEVFAACFGGVSKAWPSSDFGSFRFGCSAVRRLDVSKLLSCK